MITNTTILSLQISSLLSLTIISSLSAMDLVNKLMNIFLPLITFNALLFLLPPYLLFKFLLSIFTPFFTENVAGKVVLITGASSGIGEHLAYEYAKRGAYLVLAARRQNSLRQVAETALLLGSPDVVAVRTDVSRVEDCKQLIDEAINHFGQLDHLVNNAGITSICMFEDVPDVTTFAPVMDINFWGSVYTTHFAIPHLKESRGKIIGIASSAGWVNAARLTFYCASKAAIISFYETLRIELGSNVGITIITPGLVESEMTQGKFLTKEGRLELDQEMRDVEMNVMPIASVESCAKAIVNSACRGDKYLAEPYWIRTAIYLKMFWPESIEWCNRLFLMTPPGVPPQEAIGKKILDLTGLKKILYPDSVLSPELKVD